MLRKIIFLICLFAVIFSNSVRAGGGRFEINLIDRYGVAGTKNVRVEALLRKSGDTFDPSVGEKAEFRLLNPRQGDFCTTTQNITDSGGYIRGECGASTPGGLTIYVHSLDRNEDSATKAYVQFHAPPAASPIIDTTKPVVPNIPLATPDPSPAVTPMPSPWPSPSTSPLLFGSLIYNRPLKLVVLFGLLTVVLMLLLRSKKRNKKFLIALLGLIAILIAGTLFYDPQISNTAQETIPQTTIPDTHPPEADQELNGPAEGATINTNSTCFTSFYEDSESPPVFIRSSFDGGVWGEWSEDQTACFEKLKNGAHVFAVQAKDTMGNETEVLERNFSSLFFVDIPVTIRGLVYHDKNCNYQIDGDELPMPHTKVVIFKFDNDEITTLSSKTYGEDGLYSFSTSIKESETIVVQPSPWRDGYSIIAFSGLPQQVTLSSSNRLAIQDLPMIDNSSTSLCH